MEDKLKRYLVLWIRMTTIATQQAFESRLGAIIFIIGKVLRLVFFFFLIYIIALRSKQIAGYTIWQLAFFYLTYSIIDLMGQFFLREVYRFRSQILDGNFDYTLIKPISPLFRSLFGGSDMFDGLMIVIVSFFIILSFQHIPSFSFGSLALYILLVFNGFIMQLAFHIFTLCVGVMTTEVDNSIMLFRDLTSMAKFPIDIYKEPLRAFLTFVIPLGVMLTFPAKVLLGILSPTFILLSFALGIFLLLLSLKAWSFAIQKYTSASS